MHYFTADLHLGHRAIIDHCYRPFGSVEEMDATLLENINSVVSKGDLLYVLGDFSLGNRQAVTEQRAKILCRQVFLLQGNHDRLSPAQYAEAGFQYKGGLLDLRVEDQALTLCHYAMRRWNKSHHGAWHLFGHSHGHLPDDPKLFAFDVGVDCHAYKPLAWPHVRELMLQRIEAFSEPNHV